LDYYFSQPQFQKDIKRALSEFFDLAPQSKIDESKIDLAEETGLFNEWFVYDFKLSNGRTPLGDFYLTNPDNLDATRLQVYKDLQDNCYGFYKVKEVRLGEGLLLENLQTGRVYWVKECLLTFSVSAEQVFPGRVAKVGGHYELVSANPPLLPIKMSQSLERTYRRSKEDWNPKVIWDYFFREERETIPPKKFSTLKDAEENLQNVLTKFGLNKFVDSATIKEWIDNELVGELSTSLHLLLSLIPLKRKDYNDAWVEITESLIQFYNLCPQKRLGGKSPSEKAREASEKGLLPDIKMSVSGNPIPTMYEKYHQVVESLNERDFDRALKKINRFFAYLLENRITYPEIFRVYANKAVCHLVRGELAAGKLFLEIALELNPFYRLAKRHLKRVSRQFPDLSRESETKVIRDIGYQYYQFLKPLKINFAQK